MTSIPTQSDLVELGIRLADSGFGRHEEELRQVFSTAVEADLKPVLLAIILDRAATPVMRGRALAKLTQAWPGCRQELLAHQDRAFEIGMDALIAAWVAHDDLKRARPSIADLSESRASLDHERLALATQRRCYVG